MGLLLMSSGTQSITPITVSITWINALGFNISGAGGGIRTHGGLRQRMSQETIVVRLSPPPSPRGVDPLFRPGSGTPASFYSIHVFGLNIACYCVKFRNFFVSGDIVELGVSPYS